MKQTNVNNKNKYNGSHEIFGNYHKTKLFCAQNGITKRVLNKENKHKMNYLFEKQIDIEH